MISLAHELFMSEHYPVTLKVLQNKYQRTSPHEGGIPEDAEEGEAKGGEETST